MKRNGCNRSGRRANRALVLVSSVFCIGATTHIVSANTTATWNGASGLGGAGNWTDAASWSTGIVPDNGTTKYDVAIDGGKPAASTVSILTGGSFHIDNLTVDSNDALNINNGSVLTLAADGVAAAVTNNGDINLSSTASFTDLIIAGSISLSGSGTLQLSNNFNNRIYASANQTLTIGSGQTIQGAGQIGAGQTTIVNNGIIDANTSAGMTLSPGASGFTNNNLIEASGAVLTLNGSYTNTAATIKALTGGEIKFTNSSVTGGALSTTGTGFIDFTSSDTINNVTINGNSNEENAASVTVAGGALANDGIYTMNSSGSFTDLIVNATTVISGFGTFQLSNFVTNRIYANGNQTLTIGSGQTIQGAGQIGVGLTSLVNNGVINANSSAGLTVSVSGPASTNSNLIEATNGSTLTLVGSISNTGPGVITASDTAAIALSGANISNNSIIGTATGKITSTGSSALNNLTVNGPLVNSSGTLALNTVTLSGNYTANNAAFTNASGTLTNNATFTLNSTGSNTDLQITANTMLSGAGTLQLSNFVSNRIYANGNQTLTVGSDQTIQGAGQIGVGQTTIVNNGTIDANTSAGMTIDPGGGGFTNNDLIEASGAVLTLNGSYTNTAATIQALAGGEVKLSGATVTGGILSTTGTGFIDFASIDTINNVTINGNSNQETGASVTVAGGALANNGIYTMNSSGSNTDLIINATTALSGTGTFQLSNVVTNRIYASGNQTLTIGSGQTIQGSGQIGAGQTVLANNGVINANSSAGLIVSVSGTASTNSNLMEATNGGTLTLNGTYTNTGSGVVTASGTAAIALNAANISNNSITGTATGKITSTGSSALNNLTVNGPLVNNSGTLALNTVTLSGNYTANNASITDVSGTLINNGTFTLNSTGSNTDMQITTNTPLNGTGTVQLSNNFNNRIYGSATLTIGSGQTIQGAGQIGFGQITFVNNGIIDANASAGMTISPGGGGFTNNNLIEASGAVLTLNGSYTNTAATIEALTGGEVKLNNATVTGGIFSTTGTGFIDFTSNDTINNVTINGNSNQENAASVTVAGGALANNGIYTMNSTGSNTDLIVNATTAISGAGMFQLSNSANNRIYASGNQTLTIGSGQTIQGAGQVGMGQTVLANNGIINANSSAGLTVSVSGTTSTTNNLLEATSGGTLHLVGTLTNTSVLSTDSTGTILLTGVLNQSAAGNISNAGSISNTGTLTNNATSSITNSGALTVSAPGSISNSGAIKVDMGGTATISTGLPGGGKVTVGDPSGPLSHLTVSSITQNSLLIDVTGRVMIAHNASTTTNTLNSLTINSGGQLDMSNNHLFINYGAGPDPIASIAAWIVSGYASGAWNGAGIMSTSAQTNGASYGIGYADSADPGNPAGLSSGQIEIKYTLLGDANLDGAVNGSDFAILASNFNKAVGGWDQGDFNYDGAANGTDFADLAANFNKGASQSATGELDNFAATNGLMADVPEPAQLAIMVTAGLGILRRRQRTSRLGS